MLSDQLIKYLENSDFFESDNDAKTRERVLGRLDFLLKRFINKQSILRGETRNCGGKIFTFGSYRLGVHDKGADIDVLCVVPRHISRRDFFNIFYFELEEDENVTDLSKIEDAYVPLIKMKFFNIPIDVTMARVNLGVINDNLNILNDSILKSMDEKCILSLNGSRVTDEMLNLVPNKINFHIALRGIKFWAKRRFIYGNTYGYFGGVAFSISVAKICQMFPNASGFEIMEKYFEIYANWNWPEPVELKKPVDHNFNLKIWDPIKYPSDRYHKMPVITPAYPSMCSTHNITQSTFDLIMKELKRADEIIKNFNKSKINLNCFKKSFLVCGAEGGSGEGVSAEGVIAEGISANASTSASSCGSTGEGISSNTPTSTANSASAVAVELFDKLFDFTDFFKKFKIFIDVFIKADDSDFKSWEGYIESKIRILSNKLENSEDIIYAIPFPKSFKNSKNEEEENSKNENEEINSNSKNENSNSKNENSNSKNENSNSKNENSNSKNEILNSKNENKNLGQFSSHFFIGIEIVKNQTQNKKIYVDGEIKEFLDFVNDWSNKSSSMKIEISSKRKKEIKEFLINYN